MVRAWYHDNRDDDQKAPHTSDPPEYIDLEELDKRTGVQYWQVNIENDNGLVEKIRKDRGYDYEDQIDINKDLGEAKLKAFYTEHLHQDEEVRLFIDGSGYFDVRGTDDRWIRIEAVKGDLIILPGGIYHRFTLDKTEYAGLRRFFQGEPVWSAFNRGTETEKMECRKTYAESIMKS